MLPGGDCGDYLMKVAFHTGDESPDLLFEVEHDNHAGGWVPLKGDLVVWEHTDWIVTNRSWELNPGKEPVLRVWMAMA